MNSSSGFEARLFPHLDIVKEHKRYIYVRRLALIWSNIVSWLAQKVTLAHFQTEEHAHTRSQRKVMPKNRRFFAKPFLYQLRGSYHRM